jgi:hypothetical protein
MTAHDEFCPDCEVTMDLHDDSLSPDDACEAAQAWADAIERMERAMGGVMLR